MLFSKEAEVWRGCPLPKSASTVCVIKRTRTLMHIDGVSRLVQQILKPRNVGNCTIVVVYIYTDQDFRSPYTSTKMSSFNLLLPVLVTVLEIACLHDSPSWTSDDLGSPNQLTSTRNETCSLLKLGNYMQNRRDNLHHPSLLYIPVYLKIVNFIQRLKENFEEFTSHIFSHMYICIRVPILMRMKLVCSHNYSDYYFKVRYRCKCTSFHCS